jgi:hypothetical protein
MWLNREIDTWYDTESSELFSTGFQILLELRSCSFSYSRHRFSALQISSWAASKNGDTFHWLNSFSCRPSHIHRARPLTFRCRVHSSNFCWQGKERSRIYAIAAQNPGTSNTGLRQSSNWMSDCFDILKSVWKGYTISLPRREIPVCSCRTRILCPIFHSTLKRMSLFRSTARWVAIPFRCVCFGVDLESGWLPWITLK